MTTQATNVNNVHIDRAGSILIRCRRCGLRHPVSGDVVLAGLLRRSCPRCYPPRTDDESEVA